MTDSWYDIEFALDRFATQLTNHLGSNLETCRIIRDVFGRISLAARKETIEPVLDAIKNNIPAELKPYLAGPNFILSFDTPILDAILAEKGIVLRTKISGQKYHLIDRRIAGEDWLQQPSSIDVEIPRFAFYGLKGGVGRSTALAVSAAGLAALGLNILTIDLDLEAPGLGSILLSPDKQPEYGVLDWLASGTAGLDASSIIPDMIGGSPFTSGSGVVDVVPASGTSTIQQPAGFLSKIARAYTPGAAEGDLRGLSFTQKIQKLISQLSERRKYDVILLDVRAGLHETSAASLLGSGAKVLLFGNNSSQTNAGYKILLSNVRQVIESWPEAPDLRNNFRMIHSRAAANLSDRAEYRVGCWQLWLDTLYDAAEGEPDPTLFSFDLDDEEGPHFPWTIPHSETYLSFDPQKDPVHLRHSTYDPVFSEFIAKIYFWMTQRGKNE